MNSREVSKYSETSLGKHGLQKRRSYDTETRNCRIGYGDSKRQNGNRKGISEDTTKLLDYFKTGQPTDHYTKDIQKQVETFWKQRVSFFVS